MTVPERLRGARRKLKKRQRDIADEIGCTQPTIADWELGRALPRLQDLRTVAKAYGLKPEQLIPDETESAA